MDKTISTEKEIEVRFSDVDMTGVVWHGTYVRYLEDAREAFGTRYGLSYGKYIEENTIVPLVELNLSYRRPLRYGMKALVKIIYRPSDAAKLIFDYSITDLSSEVEYLSARSVQVFLDREGNLMWEAPGFYRDWKKNMGL